MRPILVMVILVAMAVLFIIPVVHCDRTVPQSRAIEEVALSSSNVTVFPKAPTSGSMVEVRVGGGGENPERALRVIGSNQFFAEVTEEPAQATYILGALAPGAYEFSLFRQIPATPHCSHRLLGKVFFNVQPAEHAGSGRLVLLLEGGEQKEAETLTEKEKPRVEWLFGSTAVLWVIPGLEESYRELLNLNPEVESVGLNPIGFIPECPPPLSPAFAPGSLVVSFREGITRSQAEELLRQLPPTLEGLWLLEGIPSKGNEEAPLGMALLKVPCDWEALFLQQYLSYHDVSGGLVIRSDR